MLYAVMLGMRVWICCVVWRFSAGAGIISGRYSVLRRQFLTTTDSKGKPIERKIMDY
jgi:hypothetical protein